MVSFPAIVIKYWLAQFKGERDDLGSEFQVTVHHHGGGSLCQKWEGAGYIALAVKSQSMTNSCFALAFSPIWYSPGSHALVIVLPIVKMALPTSIYNQAIPYRIDFMFLLF